MLTTPQQIAKYFQDSVSFDFQKGAVSSYNQIAREKENFYTLLDRDAFSALLNDCLYHDNQLADIFLDLFDAQLGIRKFANAGTRNSPRSLIVHFLNLPKYQYHASDVAKVYVAVNTWLVFFGAATVSPEWTVCPFCGNSVAKGVCTGRACKRTTAQCLAAASELAEMLADERRGEETADPAFWKDIAIGSEFYIAYKHEIERIRQDRKNEVLLQEQQERKNILEDAVEEINKLTAWVDIEAGKDDPDYDAVLQELSDNPVIKRALKYGDEEVNKKITSLKKRVTKKKKEHQAAQDERDKERAFQETLSAFLQNLVLLEQELVSGTRSLAEIKNLFTETDKGYTKITAGVRSGKQIENPEDVEALQRYESETRAQAAAYIADTEHKEKLLEKQKQLISKVNVLINKFEQADPKDDKAKELSEEFNREIECNKGYDDLRLERKTQYDEIVNPVRVRLAELHKKENVVKLKEFSAQAAALLAEIDEALPSENKAAGFQKRLEEIKKSKYYVSIRGKAEYERTLNTLQEKIDTLTKREKIYQAELATEQRERAKKARRRKIVSIAVAVCLFVCAAATFLCELAGVLPLSIVLAPTVNGFTAVVEDGGVTVTGLETKEKNISVPAQARVGWQFKQSPTKKIGDGAFSDCASVETVELPETVEEIGAMAFSACENLRRVTLRGIAPPQLAEDAFSGSTPVFYVPADSYAAYAQDESWSVYADRIFPDRGLELLQAMVLFDENGGDEVADISAHPINTLCTLPTAERYGHAFEGWYYYTAEGEERLFDPAQTLLRESVRLTAKWSVGKYALTFDYAGGTGDVTQKNIVYGEEYGGLPAASREGYTFAGWYVNGKKIEETSKADVSANATATAKWTANTYAVTFEYNGGVVAEQEKEVVFDGKYGALPATSRAGYIFEGWFVGEEEITSSSQVTTAQAHVVSAKWTAIEYKISYQLNKGEMEFTETACVYDRAFTLSAPTRAGYAFTGWEHNGKVYQAGEVLTNLTEINGDVLLFSAQWSANVNQIVYEANGGVGSMPVSELATDGVFNLPKNLFTREGYSFKGWSLSANGEVAYFDEAVYVMGAQNAYILYAVWEAGENKLTLRYVLGEQTLQTEELFIHTDETVVLPTPFARAGYALTGWSDEQDGEKRYNAGAPYTMGAQDASLYALWTANENVLRFDANSGLGNMPDEKIATDATVALPLNTFEKTGYSFAGWATSANGEAVYADGGEYTMGTQESYVLYAVWTKDVYDILYATNGGINNEANPKEYSVDSDEILLQAPARAGYQFVCWCTDEGLTNVATAIPKGSTGTKVFYAKWTANVNLLRFDANGGEGSMDDVRLATDAVQALPSNKFVKRGYSFIGWKKTADENEGATYADGAFYVMGSEPSYTLYAVWSLNVYQIDYILNGGENHADNPSSYTVESGTIAFAQPTRAGYTFGGWYADETWTNEKTGVESGSVGGFAVYAKWTANLNTLHFEPNGGYVSMMGGITELQMATDSVKEIPNCRITKSGYSFVGWAISDDPEAGAVYETGDLYVMGPDAEYTLYAVWHLNTYYITYYLNGGVNDESNPTSYTKESEDIVFAAPTREGYTFYGWYVGPSTATEITGIKKGSYGSKEAYARWKANVNLLRFDGNGGEGSMNSMEINTGATAVLPANAFTKEGSRFAGWSETQGGAAAYGDKSAFTMGTKAETVLYAVWSQTQFSIQYDLDGGVNSAVNPSGYNTEAAAILFGDPTKTGNTFDGWYTDSEFTNRITGISTGDTGDYILYAKWIKNTYTVTFDYNGGTLFAGEEGARSKTVTYSEAYGDLLTLEKIGHDFLGWYYNDTLIDETTTVVFDFDHTLVARFAAASYTITFNAGSGTSDTPSKTVVYGDTYGALPTATKKGSEFGGWYYGEVQITESTVMNVAKNHILNAEWFKYYYTVTFDYNGGTGTLASKQVTYGDGNTYGGLPTPTKPGHKFVGWYYGSTLVSASTVVPVADHHTLVAQWKANEHYLYISENHVDITVTRTDTNKTVSSGTLIPYGTQLSVSFTTDSGYHDGWCDYSGQTISMPDNDLTINSGATEDAPEGNSCLVKGTMITLVGGEQRPVEEIALGDAILTFDHTTGEYVQTEVGFVFSAFGKCPIISLTFEGGILVEIVNNHGFYDLDLQRYVLIGAQNAAEFVGHTFVYTWFEGGMAQTKAVRLQSCTVEERYVERYDIVAKNNMNVYANGMLTCSDMLVGVSNTFAFDGLVYDQAQMAADIAKYGLYEYAEWEQHLSYGEFVAYNGAYYKIAVEKGLITKEQILSLLHFLHSMQ